MQFYLDDYKINKRRQAGCPLHDPLAVAAALHPDLMITMPVNLKAELEEAVGRDRTGTDLTRLNAPQKNHQRGAALTFRAFWNCLSTHWNDLLEIVNRDLKMLGKTGSKAGEC